MAIRGFASRWSRVAGIAVIVSGLSLLLASCGGGAAKNDTFGLSSVPDVTGPTARGQQILVPEPSALKALDSDQIVIRPSLAEIQYLSRSQLNDRLPKIVQAKLVQAFENTGVVGGVGKPGEGLAIDFQVVTDIRAFEVRTDGPDTAVVELSVKIVNDRNGTVRAQKVFRGSAPVGGAGNPAFVMALDAAFAGVTADIVAWTLKAI